MQGFAAATMTMVDCEQSHSHEAKSLFAGHNHAAHSGHYEATSHEATQHVADISTTHHSSTSKHSCTQCGSVCCSSTAIVTSSRNAHPQFDVIRVNLTYSAPKFTSFVSAGLERPPRSILV